MESISLGIPAMYAPAYRIGTKPAMSCRSAGPSSKNLQSKGKTVALEKDEKKDAQPQAEQRGGERAGNKGGGKLSKKEAGQAAELVKTGGEEQPLGKRLALQEVPEAEQDGWTVQQGAAPVEPDALPGQVFVVSQLPDPDVQRAAGIDPVQQNAGLIVLDEEENLQHPSGLEPSDAVLSTKVVEGVVAPAERM